MLSLFMLLAVVRTGMIETMDYYLDYINVNYVTQMEFHFKLENGLGPNCYFSLYFPFAFNEPLQINYNKQSSTDCSEISYMPGQIFQKSVKQIDDSPNYWYHFRFYELDGTSAELLPNVFYKLSIQSLSGPLLSGVQPMVFSPLQALTIADYTINEPNWLIYDMNRVFAVLELVSDPSPTLIVDVNFDSQIVGDIHNIIVNFTVNVEIEFAYRIVINLLDQDYQFYGRKCSILNFTGQYDCNIQDNQIITIISQGIHINDIIQIQVSLMNPSYVKAAGGGVQVFTMDAYANRIIEIGTASGMFQTKGSTFTNKSFKTYFAWDLDITAKFNTPIKIYRSDQQAVNPFFNSFRFQFNPPIDTPINTEVRVSLRLDAEESSLVLEGSYLENLPHYGQSPVKCIIDNNIPTQKMIVCSNVGQLKSTLWYSISVQVMIPYSIPPSLTSPPSDLSVNFGKIKVETLSTNKIWVTLIQEQRDPNAIFHTQNIFNILPQYPNNGFTFAHSQPYIEVPNSNPTQLIINPLSSSTYGIKQSDQMQTLVFSVQLSPLDLSELLQPSMGFDIFTSPLIQITNILPTPVTSQTGSFSNVPAQNLITKSQQYTRIRIGVDNSIDLNTIFAPSTSSTREFGIGPVQIGFVSSPYAGERTLDFFGGTYDYLYQSPEGQIVKRFAYNSYIIPSQYGYLPNLHVSVVNYWTGITDGLDGTKFPAFIRVSGSVTSSEIQGASKLVIFFSNLQPFIEDIDEYGRKTVSCSSTFLKTNCTSYQGNSNSRQSIYSIHRVELDVSNMNTLIGPASPFQILIPVKTLPTTNPITIFLSLGVMIKHTNYPYMKDFTELYAFKQSLTTMNFSPQIFQTEPTILNQEYRLIIEQAKVGQLNSQAQIKVGHIDPSKLISKNIEFTQIGAGFFYQGQFNMISSSFQVVQSLTDYTNPRKCLTYTYQQNIRYWGFFCPFSINDITANTKFSLVGFNFPNIMGINIPQNTYAGWSSNNGAMVTYYLDPGNTYMDPGDIFVPDTIYPTLNKAWNDQYLIWQLQVSNPIPSGGAIYIQFQTGITWSFILIDGLRCFLKGEDQQKQQNHNCTMTFQSDALIKYVLFTFDGSDFIVQNYKLYQYGFNQPNTNANELIYQITTLLPDLTTIIDQSSFTCLLKFNNAFLNQSIIVQKINMNFLSPNSRGPFQMQFQLNGRGILLGQWIRFDLTLLNNNNPKGMQCFVLNSSNQVSFIWRYINMNKLNQVDLYPMNDIYDKNQVFTLSCQNTFTPTSYSNPMISVLYSGGTVYSTQTQTISLNISNVVPTSISSAGFQIIKTFIQAQTQIAISIQLTLNFIMNVKAAIYVSLPLYYNSYDSLKTLTCQINGFETFCQYYGERLIKIKLFQFQVQAKTSFSIKIIGILQPPNSISIDNLCIMADSDDDPIFVDQIGLLSDLQPAITDNVISFPIKQLNISNLYMRELSNFNFSTTTTSKLTISQYIFIDFPQDYGLLLQMKPPQNCSASIIGESVIFGSSCSAEGNRLALKVSSTVPNGTDYLIQIQGLVNPEQSGCILDKTSLMTLSLDNSTVLSRSSIAASNFKQFQFTQNPALRYTFWRRESSIPSDYLIQSYDDPQLIILNRDTLQIIPGQYSQLLSLGVVGRAFDKIITYTIQSSTGTFQILGDGIIYPGDGKSFLRIGCTSTTYAQLYFINFIKHELDGIITYADIGIISVDVVNIQKQILVDHSLYQIPLLQKSPPIILDFTNYIPLENLIVQLTLMAYDVNNPPGLRFSESQTAQYSLIFNQTNFIHSFHVESFLNITISSSSQAYILFTLSGPGNTNYNPPNIKFVLVNNNPIQNIIIFNVPQVADSAISHTIQFQSNTPVQIYYLVALQGTIVQNLQYVQDRVYNQFSYGEYFQQQFGQISLIDNFNTPLNVKIQNLKARTWYQLKAWTIDLYNTITESELYYFITQSNNGRLMKLSMVFNYNLTSQFKYDIACFLCTSFSYPCSNVLSQDAIYCTNSTRGGLEYNSTRNHTFYDSYRILQQGTQILSYFFIPIATISNDYSWQSVVNGLQNNNFEFPGLLFTQDLKEVVTSVAPGFTTQINIQIGLTWIGINNIGVNRAGMIWGYYVEKFNQTGRKLDSYPPTTQQIKYKVDCLGSIIDEKRFFILYIEDPTQIYLINLTNLEVNKYYNIYLILTTEDPSLWASTSDLSSFEVKTLNNYIQAPIISILGKQLLVSFMILIITQFI